MGSLSEECARWYLAEIVVALEHMHAQGIVHRDLKPGSPLKLRSCCFPVVLYWLIVTDLLLLLLLLCGAAQKIYC
jgi:hypothetical protein